MAEKSTKKSSDILVKCYGYCGKKHPKSQMKKYAGKNHCPDCYQKKIKEAEDRNKLYKTISEIFGITFPTGLMLRQIKEYRNERGYSYKNIRFAVDYIYRKKKMEPIVSKGIALVPYFYDEMIDYYKDLKEKRENTEFKKYETVKITLAPIPIDSSYREKKLINMEELLK